VRLSNATRRAKVFEKGTGGGDFQLLEMVCLAMKRVCSGGANANRQAMKFGRRRNNANQYSIGTRR
jgi:hypothetical protein